MPPPSNSEVMTSRICGARHGRAAAMMDVLLFAAETSLSAWLSFCCLDPWEKGHLQDMVRFIALGAMTCELQSLERVCKWLRERKLCIGATIMDACITIFGSCFRIEACLSLIYLFSGHGCRIDYISRVFFWFCLVCFWTFFEIDVKRRHGLMRWRSEFSFLMFVFCFFGVDVKLTHGLMRCRGEFHFSCCLFCLFGVDVKLGDGLMRCRSEFYSLCYYFV